MEWKIGNSGTLHDQRNYSAVSREENAWFRGYSKIWGGDAVKSRLACIASLEQLMDIFKEPYDGRPASTSPLRKVPR